MSAGFRFTLGTPAANTLVAETFVRIKELWDCNLTDDAVAQYAVALVSRNQERRKMQTQLKSVLGEGGGDAVSALLDWCDCPSELSSCSAQASW